MKTIADKIISFNRHLEYTGSLPANIRIMNPFKESGTAGKISEVFYKKFYNDAHPRRLILGINPGRLGAGATGVMFTDPKRLIKECGIPFDGPLLHEPSSEFVYAVIAAYGGVEAFYNDVYIHSVCPLGFTIVDDKGKEKNYNYYDSKELTADVREFIKWNIQQQIKIIGETQTCYCLGTGKNFAFLQALNNEEHYFERIVPLEHPRFIMQYKNKSKQMYIDDYVRKLRM